jgi:hypothetical protein
MSRNIFGGACVAVMFGLLAGCGGSSVADSTVGGGASSGSGGSQTGGSTSGGTTTQTIQGIPTPSSVSVVTANNSN